MPLPRHCLKIAAAFALLALVGACGGSSSGYPSGPAMDETGDPIGPPPPGVANFVTQGVLNFRAEPGLNGVVITHLAKGVLVQPTGTVSGAWWQVSWNNMVGWVFSRYLKPAGS